MRLILHYPIGSDLVILAKFLALFGLEALREAYTS